MPLSDTLATLASTPPPTVVNQRRQALADANAAIAAHETQLGIPHRMPFLNLMQAVKRLAALESQLAAKNLTPAAAETHTKLDANILTASLKDFYAMDSATRTQFATDGGALAKSDFDRLTLSAKSKFCIAGGKIIDDSTSKHRCTAATSFNS